MFDGEVLDTADTVHRTTAKCRGVTFGSLGNTRDDFKSPGDKDGLGINYWGAEEGRRLISPELREDALSVKSNLEVKCFPKHSDAA